MGTFLSKDMSMTKFS